MARPPRKPRRSPEDARRAILDGAERVFSKSMPDEVGLKEIASASKVSHALVSHYFGTYDALVEETLERRLTATRERILQRLVTGTGEPRAILEELTQLVRDRLTMRLLTWAVLSGRSRMEDFFPARVRGLALVADGMEARLRALGATVPRARLEFSIMAAVAMAFGFAIAGPALFRATGRAELDDAELVTEMQAMLRAYVGDAGPR